MKPVRDILRPLGDWDQMVKDEVVSPFIFHGVHYRLGGGMSSFSQIVLQDSRAVVRRAIAQRMLLCTTLEEMIEGDRLSGAITLPQYRKAILEFLEKVKRMKE